MICDGMVRGLKEYFKEYNGCRNCRHQPEPMQMCEWGKNRQCVELICSGWEKKDGRFNQQTGANERVFGFCKSIEQQ